MKTDRGVWKIAAWLWITFFSDVCPMESAELARAERPRLYDIMIGGHRDNIVPWLQQSGEATLTEKSTEKSDGAEDYDRCERWTVRYRRESYTLYLFFRKEYLMARCVFPGDIHKRHRVVFEEEVLSGRQYPPKDASLWPSVRWGNALLVPNGSGHSVRLCCGVGVYPVAGRPGECDILVVVKNDDVVDFRQKVVVGLFGKPSHFGVEMRFRHKGEEEERTDVAYGAFGMAPTEVEPVIGKRVLAKLCLPAHECSYWWHRVDSINTYTSLTAHCEMIVVPPYRDVRLEAPVFRPAQSALKGD